ncbi:MAG: hypothetical protein QGI24_01765 [Kiritimatiellia bacterium]|nr:hypothetical protein [Kiritimatiellia bacterium]
MVLRIVFLAILAGTSSLEEAERHFFFDALREIEGADAGWFRVFKGGIGQLESVRFVLDGSPRNDHYPYDPNGKKGWTEGWIQHNVAYNISLAYMAYQDTEIQVNDGKVRMKVLMNLDYGSRESIRMCIGRDANRAGKDDS